MIKRILMLSIVLAVNPAFASLSEKSEERAHRKPKLWTVKFIELNDYEVEYRTGANLRYYKEYHSRQLKQNSLSFPLKDCDPLPVYHCGSLRFFFTSAIAGNCPRSGDPIVLPDPSMRVNAVRAKSDGNGHWVQVYFGYDPNQYKDVDKKRIYQAQLLAIQTKDTKHVENHLAGYFSGAKYLSNQLIGLEAKKYLENPNDWNWKSPVFQNVIQTLLPTNEGIVWNKESQCLITNIVYWTKDENKLKQIKYEH